MKVYFTRQWNNSEIWTEDYWDLSRHRHSKTSIINSDKAYVIRYTILNILSKEFKSIKFCGDSKINICDDKLSFKFNDHADEAYFILWSNDGIEI